MSTADNIISRTIFNFKGKGKTAFENGLEIPADFNIEYLSNGTATGTISFDFEDAGQMFAFASSMTRFTLTGITETENLNVKALYCFLTSTEENTSESIIKCKFQVPRLIVGEEEFSKIPTKRLLLRFGIMNAPETLGLTVETPLGPLKFASYEGIRTLEEVMKLHNTPMVTAAIELFHTPNGKENLAQIVERAIPIVKDFLKLSSFIETVWQEWAFLRIYQERDKRDEYFQTAIRTTNVKAKSPASRGITCPAHSDIMLSTLWRNYNSQIEEKFGFGYALEWYVGSNAADTIEAQFLNATTCLELLMDKYHSQQNTEFIINEETSEKLTAELKKTASEWLKSHGVDDKTRRAAIYKNLKGIHRWSYVDKAEKLVKDLKIKYPDSGIRFDDLVRIRNNITHRGKHYSKDGDRRKEFEEVNAAYEGVFSILTKIFLAILNYNGRYFDPTKQEWLNFKDVLVTEPKS